MVREPVREGEHVGWGEQGSCHGAGDVDRE